MGGWSRKEGVMHYMYPFKPVCHYEDISHSLKLLKIIKSQASAEKHLLISWNSNIFMSHASHYADCFKQRYAVLGGGGRTETYVTKSFFWLSEIPERFSLGIK